MTRLLKMLAPWLAVAICFCWLRSAWLALLAYHVQILLWSRGRLAGTGRGWAWRGLLFFAAPCALAGPLAFLLLPAMTGDASASQWLAAHGVPSWSLVLLVPYFGLVHPLLEQAHWGPLRAGTRCSPLFHAAFAGYHALVLQSLLRWEWTAACCLVLFAASVVWTRIQKASGGLAVPVAGHVLADLGIVLAAVLRTG